MSLSARAPVVSCPQARPGACAVAPRPAPAARGSPSSVRPGPAPSHSTSSYSITPSHRPGQTPTRGGAACRSYAYGSAGPSGGEKREAALEALRGQLRQLEEERDEAVRTAESCAKTCVRLTDMSKLLQDLALEKVKAGDDAGAKLVLQEKNALKEIIDKSAAKAQTNFALAGKLATAIGLKHNELVGLMSAAGQGGPAPAPAPPAAPAPAQAPTYGGGQSAYGTWPGAAGPSAYGGGVGGGGGGGYAAGGLGSGVGGGGGYEMPWERSLKDAQQRARQAEADAQRIGRLAAMGAEEAIAAARERLAARAAPSEGVVQARDRLRRGAEESIAAARERLRAQDAQVLEYCRRIVARYRRGEAVAEEELEFAFEQLERRLL